MPPPVSDQPQMETQPVRQPIVNMNALLSSQLFWGALLGAGLVLLVQHQYKKGKGGGSRPMRNVTPADE